MCFDCSEIFTTEKSDFTAMKIFDYSENFTTVKTVFTEMECV